MAELYVCSVADQSMETMLEAPLGLPKEDIDRARRLRRASDQALHVASRWLLRKVLSDRLGPRAWSFERDRMGKLRLATHHGLDIDFSLAHTRRLVVVGLQEDGKIGVDAEDPQACGSNEELPLDVFALPERRSLEALSGSARRDAFLRLWARTEAILKAKGMGFAADPRRVRMDVNRNVALDETTGARWSCWTWRTEETGHILACAVEGPNAARPVIHRTQLPRQTAGGNCSENRTDDGFLLD